MAEIRIEPYRKAKHHRAGFDCGKPALNEFIRTLVTQYERRRQGRTFVAVRVSDPDIVAGYYHPFPSLRVPQRFTCMPMACAMAALASMAASASLSLLA